MIRAKNYETLFKFVKVMPRKLVASFFPDTVYIYKSNTNRRAYLSATLSFMFSITKVPIKTERN